MNRLLFKFCGLLLLVLCGSLASAQINGLRGDEKAAIVAVLKQFSEQRPLLRPLNLDGNPLSSGVRPISSQYMGQIGPGTGAFGSFHLGSGGWEVRQIILQPRRSDLLHTAKGNPVLSDDEQAWSLAEKQFAKELNAGQGWERGKASWQSFEGREKVAVRLTFKPRAKDYPVGGDDAGLAVQYRASDGALMQAFILPALDHKAAPVKITQEKAIKVAGRSMLPKSDKLTARLAYLMPPYGLSPGIIDRRTGKELEPALKLMWEVRGSTASAAVDPETGVVAWVFTSPQPQKELVAVEPSAGDLQSLVQETSGGVLPYDSIILQVVGGLAILFSVGFIINWLMKRDISSQV